MSKKIEEYTREEIADALKRLRQLYDLHMKMGNPLNAFDLAISIAAIEALGVK